ncbi:unnamed protein product [Aphanomyces euteiches]
MSAPPHDTQRFPGHGSRDGNDLNTNQIPVRTSSAPPIDTSYKSGGPAAFIPGQHLNPHAAPRQYTPQANYAPSGGVYQPGQPFYPRNAPPQQYAVSDAMNHAAHTGHHMNANAPPHIPGQGRNTFNPAAGGVPPAQTSRPGASVPMRGPPRINPNVQPFVPQSMAHNQPPAYVPRNGQQPGYYNQMQGAYMGGHMHNQPPMYMPHQMQYPPMQHPMGMNPNVGMGIATHPGQTPMAPAPRPAAPPQREKKVLLIIDPKTKKPINECVSLTSDASEKSDTSTAPSTPAKKPIASTLRATVAEFVLPSSVASPAPPAASPKPPVAAASPKPPAVVPPPVAVTSPKRSAPVASPKRSAPVASPKRSAPVASPKRSDPVASPKGSVASPKAAAASVPSPKPASTTEKSSVAKSVASPKAQAAPASPKSKEPSLVFGTFDVAAEETRVSPKNVSLPPGFHDVPKDEKPNEEVQADEEDTENVEEDEDKDEAPPKHTVPRPVNPQPTKNGKLCYSVEFLFSFREEYVELPAATAEPNSGWLSMEVTNDGPSRSGNRRMDRQASSGPAGPLQRQSSRGNNDKSKQWQRDQTVPRRAGGGGRGGSGGKMRQQASLDDVPLKRREDRWVPQKATSNLEKVMKQVQSIMNKMTNQKFDTLSAQLSEIDMESLEMLSSVITIIFDKALGEPHFCEMYANLCVRLEQHWKVWSFLKIVRNDDNESWYWTTMSDTDAEVVGPFETEDELLENAEEDPLEVIAAPEGLQLKEVRVRKEKFIKVWELDGQLYWSGQSLEDLGERQVLNGPFKTQDDANLNAIKTTSFKRILLNACQEEFEKDNIYETLDEALNKAREEGTLTAEVEANFEEKKMLTKRRMLGNIRFIGELYRKGMLQERIMHECVMKLMGVTRGQTQNAKAIKLVPLHPGAAPDEENIESLSKLLTTMGKDLEVKGTFPGAMAAYFDYLAYLTKDKRLSSRINFMLRDVIDLRNNRWEPRRKELKQKTLEEIRKDAEKELAASQKRPNNPPPRGVASSSSSREMGRGGNGFRGNNPPPPQRNNFALDRSRSQQIEKPGSQGRPTSFSFKGRGGASNAKAAPTPQKPVQIRPQKEIHDQLSQLSEDVTAPLAKKTKSVLEEFVGLKDVNEAVACIQELKTNNASLSSLLVSSCFAKETLKLAVEEKDAVREGMFDALVALQEQKALENDAILYGLEAAILSAPDLSCDVPKIHDHLGTILARLFTPVESLTLEWLVSGFDCESDDEAYQELVDSGVLSGVVGAFLSKIPAKVAASQSSSTFINKNLTSILPSYGRTTGDVMQWLTKFGLNNTLPAIYKAGEVVTTVKQSKKVDDVIVWIESNVSGEMRADSLFAKQTCLFLLSLSNWDIPPADHSNLLMGLCGNIEGQMAFVGGIIQEVTDDKLKPLLNYLLHEHIISDKAFLSWRDSYLRNPTKDNAMERLGDFFDTLRK